MWQNILVFAILALAGGYTLYRFYEKFTGKRSCCGGGCTCKEGCGGHGSAGTQGGGARLRPLPEVTCCNR